MLATRTGYPAVPVAHNAGYYWTPGKFTISPGTVQLVVGPTLDPTNQRASALMAEAEQWIEGMMDELKP